MKDDLPAAPSLVPGPSARRRSAGFRRTGKSGVPATSPCSGCSAVRRPGEKSAGTVPTRAPSRRSPARAPGPPGAARRTSRLPGWPKTQSPATRPTPPVLRATRTGGSAASARSASTGWPGPALVVGGWWSFGSRQLRQPPNQPLATQQTTNDDHQPPDQCLVQQLPQPGLVRQPREPRLLPELIGQAALEQPPERRWVEGAGLDDGLGPVLQSADDRIRNVRTQRLFKSRVVFPVGPLGDAAQELVVSLSCLTLQVGQLHLETPDEALVAAIGHGKLQSVRPLAENGQLPGEHPRPARIGPQR